jgi:PHD/YefM family antitoxin component YafN of YafNO toxin-antitoxin module
MASKIFLVDESKTIRVGKEPMVLIPLKLWRMVEDHLEDQEALASKNYLRRIRKARKDVAEGKVIYPFR